MADLTRDALETMSRRQLQGLAKQHDIKANLKVELELQLDFMSVAELVLVFFSRPTLSSSFWTWQKDLRFGMPPERRR